MVVRSAWYVLAWVYFIFLLLALFLSRPVCCSHRHRVRPPSAVQHDAAKPSLGFLPTEATGTKTNDPGSSKCTSGSRKFVDCDAPVQGRADRAELLSKSVHELEKEKQQQVQWDWTSADLNAEVVALWEVLEPKDRSPEKPIDLTDMKVLVAALSRTSTIETTNTNMTERIWISYVASGIVFQHLGSDTDVQLQEETVISVRVRHHYPEGNPRFLRLCSRCAPRGTAGWNSTWLTSTEESRRCH